MYLCTSGSATEPKEWTKNPVPPSFCLFQHYILPRAEEGSPAFTVQPPHGNFRRSSIKRIATSWWLLCTQSWLSLSYQSFSVMRNALFSSPSRTKTYPRNWVAVPRLILPDAGKLCQIISWRAFNSLKAKYLSTLFGESIPTMSPALGLKALPAPGDIDVISLASASFECLNVTVRSKPSRCRSIARFKNVVTSCFFTGRSSGTPYPPGMEPSFIMIFKRIRGRFFWISCMALHTSSLPELAFNFTCACFSRGEGSLFFKSYRYLLNLNAATQPLSWTVGIR